MERMFMQDILNTLEQLEPLFHAAYPHASEAEFERLVSPDFWEVGASGKIYTREFAFNTLKHRNANAANNWQATDYQVTPAGKDTYLLTYELHQATRMTRRLTVWQNTEQGWQAIYHQGTVATSESALD